MIANDVEFEQAIAQMERMYRSLAGLKARLSSADPSQFEMMTEGPVDEIRRLQKEIDTYLGVTVSAPTIADSID